MTSSSPPSVLSKTKCRLARFANHQCRETSSIGTTISFKVFYCEAYPKPCGRNFPSAQVVCYKPSSIKSHPRLMASALLVPSLLPTFNRSHQTTWEPLGTCSLSRHPPISRRRRHLASEPGYCQFSLFPARPSSRIRPFRSVHRPYRF